MKVRVGSLFSGIGLLERGLEETADFETVWQCEIDPAARSVLRRHWPGVPCYEDVKELDLDRLPDVDVLVGGWPCQDISVAGARAGLAGERSGLFHDLCRVLAAKAPRWVLLENVDGLLSSWSPTEPAPEHVRMGRRDWEVEEESDLEVVVSELVKLGYGVAWRVLDAQYFGVPQRRRRIFLVGHLGEPWSAPAQVLLEPEGLPGDPAPGGAPREDPAAPLGSQSPGSGWNDDLDRMTFIPTTGDEVADTLRSHPRPGSNSVGAVVPYNVHGENSSAMTHHGEAEGAFETERSRCVDSTGGYATNQGGTVIAHGADLAHGLRGGKRGTDDADRQTFVPVPGEVARAITAPLHGHRVDAETENFVVSVHNGDDVITADDLALPVTGSKGNPGTVAYSTKLHNTESNQSGKLYEEYTPSLQADSPPPAVLYRKTHRAKTDEDSEHWVEDELANTLDAGGHGPRTSQAVVMPIDLRQATRAPAAGAGEPGMGVGADGDPSGPVMNVPPPAVAAYRQNLAGEVFESDSSAPLRAGATGGMNQPTVQEGAMVRRLTPLECERLQGAPDGWTAVDDAGRELTDSVRYRLLGNAVCAAVTRWIGPRLRGVDMEIGAA